MSSSSPSMALVKAFGISCGVVCTKIVVLNLYSNYKRVAAQKQAAKSKENKSGVFLGLDLSLRVHKEEPQAVSMAQRALKNTVNTFVPFFAMGSIYTSSGGGETLGKAYFYGFALASCIHSYCYLKGLAPGLRNLTFASKYWINLHLAVGTALRMLYL
mmetsp:Transcript_58953/g.188342  ORF Transcript_58953/g.188342 Transcript_58953/m.188342 type:complete len:158 (+) Transcript_58953:118-591(+)|eukprot:CAMPEP_0182909726 /NCGR_PEP_ID=MMETSP0034_2-20130328/35914_1 /TAXON_ID=156128 /ORGANISM="Nephroselmis pyriformis, Strain CCMP717" /LENGTH=157 /DNA_ID=CAMNT_0025045997 /DNA_START=61 /DNA_END=534 /DNA_ORIENTATION=-